MDEIIDKIKRSFAESGNILMKNNKDLKAVFCIGSSAHEKNFHSNTYQDFDIHFYFDKSFLTKEDLDSVKDAFKTVSENFEDESTAIDYCIKDKPWKMIPRKERNIGLHGTVLNRLDLIKRMEANYILTSNMFNNSEVLVGQLQL